MAASRVRTTWESGSVSMSIFRAEFVSSVVGACIHGCGRYERGEIKWRISCAVGSCGKNKSIE